jgi:hypothetical protein
VTIHVLFTLMEHSLLGVDTLPPPNACAQLALFSMIRYHHPMLHVVLHGTTTHFYCGERVISHTNAVQLYNHFRIRVQEE